MFDEHALKELASIQTEGPILSVYLDVDPTQRTTEEYKLTLRELLKSVATTGRGGVWRFSPGRSRISGTLILWRYPCDRGSRWRDAPIFPRW